MLYMARMKFFYTIKTLKWFLTYRADSYENDANKEEVMEIIDKRAKQLYEIDKLLFDKIDMPVLIPDRILDS